MDTAEKKKLLNDLAQYVIEEFEKYNIFFEYFSIAIKNAWNRLTIGIPVKCFNDELQVNDNQILKKFVADCANNYIENYPDKERYIFKKPNTKWVLPQEDKYLNYSTADVLLAKPDGCLVDTFQDISEQDEIEIHIGIRFKE